MKILSWGASDVGMKRDHNEDSYIVVPDLNLFVVADGMGGHAGGEMASGMSVRVIRDTIAEQRKMVDAKTVHQGKIEESPVATLLSESIRRACNAVFQKSKEVPELDGMGTTTVGMCFHQGYGFIAHVGDSRAYVIREGRTTQLSEDHSLVNEQLKAGLITAAQAEKSRFKNIITRSVGFSTDVEVDRIAVETKPQDVFLLCSDGLTGLVTDDEIGAIVQENFMCRIPELLIDLANSRGGDDNITVVVMYVADEEDALWDDAADKVKVLPGGAAWNAGKLTA